MIMDLPNTLEATVKAVHNKELSITELVETTLKNISTWEPHIDAFTEVLSDEAIDSAKKIKPQKTQPLCGIPIGIKDIICTKEGHTTAASNILKNFCSPYDATVIRKLKEAGSIIIGKLNLDSFAMGASTEYSDLKITKNPWDTTKVPGGSSGGSAAAVASGEVLASLGTDTGGSIRHPSSLCNTVGLRPTYGRVSRFGAVAYGSSLDQIGPITRTVKDTAIILEAIAGQDKYDATSSPEPVGHYTNSCRQDIREIKIGVPKEFFAEGVQSEVTQTVKQAIKQLNELGAKTVDISLPLTPAGIPVYYLIAKAEGSTNLGRYDGIRLNQIDTDAETLVEQYLKTRGKGFGPEVKRTILMGTYALSAGYYDAWYKQASKVRTLIRQEFMDAFKKVDIIAGPTTPEIAWRINAKADDPLGMYMTDLLTTTSSVAGIPAISVPCGFINNLPIGLQLITPHFKEETLFQVAYTYEQSTDWHKKMPTFPGK
jgi:aspartyl-tRNA(Asn)/glutamyl-tRNA(Gln) amidotransferase subunit A